MGIKIPPKQTWLDQRSFSTKKDLQFILCKLCQFMCRGLPYFGGKNPKPLIWVCRGVKYERGSRNIQGLLTWGSLLALLKSNPIV